MRTMRGGNILSQSGAMAADKPFRYKGYHFDDETDLYYLIARYYQPTFGLFLTSDSEGGYLADSQTQNGYNYTANNPTRFVDSDGNMYVGYIKMGGLRVTTAPKGGTYKGTIPKNKVVLPTSKSAANTISKKLGGTVTALKNGYKVEIKNGKKPIVVRLMNAGSGGRSKPYFRVSVDGKGSYTLNGNLSSDKSLTHINMSSSYSSQISKIVNSIKGK